ncbi:DUF421 domain-containing protein [Actinomadura hibisca]|uniref:DUF421 domain-containing protein n=1 Tax=Actinomadura hibisca TaxID=68565 RepID=UPI00082B25DE|nr:hypothetical protein [Actinomadura hibisca]
MWQDLWGMGVPVADKAVRTVAVFLVVVLLLRFAGRRELAQLNGLDFVVMLLLSNVVQNAVIGPDNSLLGGLLGAVFLLVANGVLTRLIVHVPWVSGLVRGRVSVLAQDGAYRMRTLDRIGLRPEEVDQAIQEQGGDAVQDTRLVTLLPGGAVVVRLRRAEQSASYGDVVELRARLERIERRLEHLAAPPGGGHDHPGK